MESRYVEAIVEAMDRGDVEEAQRLVGALHRLRRRLAGGYVPRVPAWMDALPVRGGE